MPNQPSARKIGGYIMWVTFAAGCVTSTLFMTACAPNFLALEFIREIAGVEITYLQWMLASAPFALPLLLLLPILTYVFYPPQTRGGHEVPAWAAEELQKMGPLSGRERILSALVLLPITLWMLGGAYVEATTAALIVISLMLTMRVVSWKEMAGNHTAWTTGPHERHDAGDPGGRPRYTRCPGGQTRFGSRIDNRHHGRNHPPRDWARLLAR